MNNRIGKLFPPPAIYGGYTFVAFGLFLLFWIPAEGSRWIGLILIFVGLVWLVPSTGILFSVGRKQYKEYIDVLGIKFGSWKPMNDLPFIAILMGEEGWKLGNSINDQGYAVAKQFDVCLLDKTHRQQVLVKRFQDCEEAKREIVTLAEQLGVTVATYNPPHTVHRRGKGNGS